MKQPRLLRNVSLLICKVAVSLLIAASVRGGETQALAVGDKYKLVQPTTASAEIMDALRSHTSFKLLGDNWPEVYTVQFADGETADVPKIVLERALSAHSLVQEFPAAKNSVDQRIGKTYWLLNYETITFESRPTILSKSDMPASKGQSFKIKRIVKDEDYGAEDCYEVDLGQNRLGYIVVRIFDSMIYGGSIVTYDPKKREQDRVRNIKSKRWSPHLTDSVIRRKISLGMTKEQVEMSWGKPQRINRTVGTWGVHEQWIYGTTYVYFENDKLTSFQDSR